MVAREAIQPPAWRLLSDGALEARLRSLGTSRRVALERLGRSHEGRPISAIVIGAPETLGRRRYHEKVNARLSGPRCDFRTLEDVTIERDDVRQTARDARVSVMLAGASFGFEAAHVEALVALAEHLARSHEARVLRVLDRLLIVIVPLMNPDGRAAAIREWARTPLSTGHSGSGNAYGVPINRDFFNLSQPETQAVRRAVNQFHPVAAYDPHEDMYHLGATLPYACWTPPFARPYHPDIDARVIDCIGSLGAAIAEEWRGRGFNFLYDPEGEHRFLTLFRLGGRFHLHLCLQGVPALITESARMPGTQTWEDRIDQKVSAGLAFLDAVASDPLRYLEARYAVRSDMGPIDAFIFPIRANASLDVVSILASLRRHDVQVYTVTEPEPAYVVPIHQPDRRLIQALLAVSPWNHVALPPLGGVVCLRLSALPADEQVGWRRAALTGWNLSNPDAPGAAARQAVHDLGLIVEQLLGENSVIESRHARVRWAAPPRPRPRNASPGPLPLPGHPRIALYAGQGVDLRHHVLGGGARAALERLGFPYVPVEARDVREGQLSQFEMLIVPGGWAEEIVHGWEDPGPPWEMPGPRDGLGEAGLDAIRHFVERGGCLLGIGSGGGILASSGFLGLVDAVLIDEMMGEARTIIRITQSHPLVDGIPPSADETGRTARDHVAVPYYSEPFAGLHGGPIFRPGPAAQVLAEYARLEDPSTIRIPGLLDAAAHTPAVLCQSAGRGWAAVLTFEPYLRCVWSSTLPFLTNAVRVAGGEDSGGEP